MEVVVVIAAMLLLGLVIVRVAWDYPIAVLALFGVIALAGL